MWRVFQKASNDSGYDGCQACFVALFPIAIGRPSPDPMYAILIKQHMSISTKIWYDLVNSKYGDEYLMLYLSRQRKIRKWFKILTVLFSASGIFSAFQSAKIPTIISCIAIGVVQIATSIENFVIHSEEDLDRLSKLRLMYFARTNKLEELWNSLAAQKISEQDATTQFFELRQSSKETEEFDNKLNIRSVKKLKFVADANTREYLNTYYNE
jgi:hypothetical protein